MLVFSAIFPTIAIAALGYLARKRQWLSAAEGATIERIAFWFLIPCLLFIGTASAEFPATMNWNYLLAFYLSVAIVYAAGMLIGRLVYGYGLRELSAFGMGGAYSNVTVLGIPITVQILGEEAFVPMFIVITFHNLMLYTAGTILAEIHSVEAAELRAHLKRVGTEMIMNPISGSLLAGAAWNLSGLPFPAAMANTLDLLSGAAVPGAIFALGTALTRYQIRGEVAPACIIVVLKLFVLPSTMWVMMRWVFAIDLLWAQAATLLACMPVGVSVYVFSRRYEVCETAVAAAIVMSSLGAVASITLVSGLLFGL